MEYTDRIKIQLIGHYLDAILMTQNGIMIPLLGIIAILAISFATVTNNAFAEDSPTLKFADDIHTIVTFTFKDGVEVIEFPIVIMGEDYVDKNSSPSFSVEGVVGPNPYLHRALDEAFKYKANPSYQYSYQLFEVDIAYVKNGEKVKTLSYHDCMVEDYKTRTLNDSYESYTSTSSGFAITDEIEFQCSGLNPLQTIPFDSRRLEFAYTEYAHSPYKFAGDVRTLITFEFDKGIEKIEFPVFELKSGFKEDDDNVIPSFSVEGTIQKHPLLDDAIDKSRSVSGTRLGFNTDFEATVDFATENDVLRTLNFKDCHVTSAKIVTKSDKEEGFTGKSGFANVEQIGFECIGLRTTNESFDKLKASTNRNNLMESVVTTTNFPQGTGPTAVTKFTYDNGVEVISFPMFEQGKVLVKSNPSFTLTGLIEDTPILYKHVDNSLSLTSQTGSTNFLEDFDVDIDLVSGDKTIRGFNYVDCRVVDYIAKTQINNEETYFKAFANSNSINFECQGYHPNNPLYDALFTYEKAKTTNSLDLRDTSDWGPGFK